MNPEPLFKTLDPPPGGLTALRARLDAERLRSPRQRRVWAASIAVGVAAAVIVAALILSPGRPPEPQLPVPDDPVLAALTLSNVGAASVQVSASNAGTIAVEPVPLPTEDVVYYRVASLR